MSEDQPAPPPKRSIKRLLVLVGAVVLGLAATTGALAVVVVKVASVRTLWCGHVGLLCAKAAAPAPAPVHPGGCPDLRMVGLLKERAEDDPGTIMTADVKGQVQFRRQGNLVSGASSVACFDHQFLATFARMSDGITYQCQGAFDEKAYAGVCARSGTGPQDVAGTFTN